MVDRRCIIGQRNLTPRYITSHNLPYQHRVRILQVGWIYLYSFLIL